MLLVLHITAGKCEENTTRLIKIDYYSRNNGEGLVRICLNGQWRFVCDDGWDENARRVFCKNPYTEGEECCVMTDIVKRAKGSDVCVRCMCGARWRCNLCYNTILKHPT